MSPLVLSLLIGVNGDLDLDYAKVARDANWTWSARKAWADICFDEHLKGRSNIFEDGTKTVVIRMERWSLALPREGVFTRSGHTLFVCDFQPNATGCCVIAYDVRNGKQLWKVKLKGIGPIKHSSVTYQNRVNVETDGRAVTVWGNELAGRYVEILDAKTGKMLGHNTFGPSR